MSKKILAVLGATGQQGNSVVDHVLRDAELSKQYKIRAITRDVNSSKARQLEQKAADIEVVAADVSDRYSLEAAFENVDTVFAMTLPSFAPDGLETEYQAGKTVADVALDKGVKYIIFSTLPGISEISKGKYNKVTYFDAKAKIEKYIRSLPIKSAFHSPGFFMENFLSYPFLGPIKEDDGVTYSLRRHNSPNSKLPLINAAGDTGKFVAAILADPDRYEGKTFASASGLYSYEEMADAIAKATGKRVVFRQISQEEFEKSLPFAGDMFAESFTYMEEYGYNGADTEAQVAWAVEHARGKVISFEEFLKANPLKLE